MKWNYDYFTKKFKHMPEQLELVCIGTTQGHFAFDFSDCEIRAFNMSVWLNYFTYSKRLLEKYKHKIAPQATILITLEYPIFLCNEETSWTIGNALQYSKILFGRDPHVSLFKQCIYRALPDSRWSADNFSAIKNMDLRNRNLNHYKLWELEQNVQNVIDAWGKATACGDLRKCKSQIMQSQRNRMDKAIDDVMDIIRLCKQCEWRPVLVALPFSRIFNDKLSSDFKTYYFYQCIDEIVSRTGCCFFDYSNDQRMDKIHYYMDIWWLNERGRKKFTKIVLNECLA